MSTLAVMKARIADEITRQDLPDAIANAISDAISYYQRQRFYFNEADNITFSTVASQYEYTSSDAAQIPYLYDVDAMFVTVSSQNYLVERMSPEEWRLSYDGSTSGQPYRYAYFNQVIRLYPTPNDAWTVRLQGHVRLAAPASDAEASNKWMIDAEELIRARAKRMLYRDVLGEMDRSAMSRELEDDAFRMLNAQSNMMQARGQIVPMAF